MNRLQPSQASCSRSWKRCPRNLYGRSIQGIAHSLAVWCRATFRTECGYAPVLPATAKDCAVFPSWASETSDLKNPISQFSLRDCRCCYFRKFKLCFWKCFCNPSFCFFRHFWKLKEIVFANGVCNVLSVAESYPKPNQWILVRVHFAPPLYSSHILRSSISPMIFASDNSQTPSIGS